MKVNNIFDTKNNVWVCFTLCTSFKVREQGQADSPFLRSACGDTTPRAASRKRTAHAGDSVRKNVLSVLSSKQRWGPPAGPQGPLAIL